MRMNLEISFWWIRLRRVNILLMDNSGRVSFWQANIFFLGLDSKVNLRFPPFFPSLMLQKHLKSNKANLQLANLDPFIVEQHCNGVLYVSQWRN